MASRMASRNDAAKRPSGWKSRPRQGLHLRPLNVEKGAERFSAAEDVFPPQAATWRNNLVALSQRRNLLFVAYNHQVYVWEPSGASQVLGFKPEMIITPAMKSPESHGYIAPHLPHAINNMIVDDLGREEILLLATDSGNVTGYRVEAIFSALKRAAKGNQIHPLDGSQVDAFFTEYVEASAWGLAIHKFARLIAVTANTGLISVFAFALVSPASEKRRRYPFEEDSDLSDCGQTWLHIKNNAQFVQLRQLMPDNHRARNVKLTYTGHFTNIPSVSFLNCDLDPNGVWMVSTDIDNKLFVWKVWESLGPFNVYHFNDIAFKSIAEAFYNDTERGWAVIALDPRSFHPLKFKEDACGGPPRPCMKDGRTVLDLTKLNSQIPNASQLYNYFPPAVRIEPEQPVLPDIFGPDCRIGTEHGIPQDIGDPADASDHTVDGNLRPSDSTDSAPEENMSQGSDGSSDVDLEAEPPQGTGHVPQNTGNNPGPQTNDAPQQPGHDNLTTAEFLQFALIEALGGDLPVPDGYYDNGSDDYSDDEPMDDTDDNYSDDGETPATRALAYQVFDRMLRSAFPDDPVHCGQTERLMALPPAPAPICSHFPIIQFSQTDIRLVPDPFAPHATVVCGSPLRQPFTHPIVSIRASDRFNMVKYIPEHGLIVAASQKGRAAVISLTESEDTGVAFRVDWIVPFESQERYGDRPLIPLLGMSVGPIQGFEMPPDVPYIPRGVSNDDEATFHFRFIKQDDDAHKSPPKPQPARNESEFDGEEARGKRMPQLTLPECHAKASRVYQPEESWRGRHPSRRYRLLLMYADHTIMSYEFWYDWRSVTAGEESDDG